MLRVEARARGGTRVICARDISRGGQVLVGIIVNVENDLMSIEYDEGSARPSLPYE